MDTKLFLLKLQTFFKQEKEENFVVRKKKQVKIKLYQLALTSYSILGISSDQSIQKYPFNWNRLMVSLSYASSSIFYLIRYENELKFASSFAEYTDWIFTFTSTISVDIFYIFTILYKSKLFKFVDNCEKIVTTSELNWNSKWIKKVIKKTTTTNFRIWIKRNICWGQWTSREMESNHTFHNNKSFSHLLGCAEINFLPIHVFFHGFVGRRFWIANSLLVSLICNFFLTIFYCNAPTITLGSRLITKVAVQLEKSVRVSDCHHLTICYDDLLFPVCRKFDITWHILVHIFRCCSRRYDSSIEFDRWGA